jgi:hypothetical protein
MECLWDVGLGLRRAELDLSELTRVVEIGRIGSRRDVSDIIDGGGGTYG